MKKLIISFPLKKIITRKHCRSAVVTSTIINQLNEIAKKENMPNDLNIFYDTSFAGVDRLDNNDNNDNDHIDKNKIEELLHHPDKFQIPHHNNKLQVVDKINAQSTNNNENFDNTEEEIIFDYNESELFENNDIDVQNIFNEDQDGEQSINFDTNSNKIIEKPNEVLQLKLMNEKLYHDYYDKNDIDNITENNGNEESEIRGCQPNRKYRNYCTSPHQ